MVTNRFGSETAVEACDLFASSRDGDMKVTIPLGRQLP